MRITGKKTSLVVAAVGLILMVFLSSGAVTAQTEEIDELFEQLREPVDGNWQAIEARIWKAWSRSGSEAMDLLLERGRRAMRDGDFDKAIEHLTALTDHAPEFAEGWNARATLFFMMEEYALSVQDIETTLALNPRHFGALAGLGMILERLDQPEDALRVYRAALAVHPFRPDLHEAVERLEEKTDGTSL